MVLFAVALATVAAILANVLRDSDPSDAIQPQAVQRAAPAQPAPQE